tara:strand:+ start:229 stop:675 length:447 start_codon:yes stop_codon:yes gene_type:complete
MIIGIHHVAISVPNMDKAVAFYQETLGFQRVFGNSWNGDRPEADRVIGVTESHAKVVMLRTGNAYLELWEYDNPKPKSKGENYSPADHGFAHICLQVSDIQAEYDRLIEAGMTFHAPPVQLGESLAIYGRDPFGNILELYEPSADRSL